jgi:uncharacterized repeat protein (TIGR03806 family)
MPASKLKYYWFSFACLIIVTVSCSQKKDKAIVAVAEEQVDLSHIGKATLSEYGFFEGALKELNPAAGVTPYQLNAALFSDYAFKARFVKLPAGAKAVYNAEDVLDFPIGTTLIKNFYYPADFSKPQESIRILETRLLLHEADGWKALPYIWNDEQTEAYLDIAGKNIPVSWTHYNGELKSISYSVPNMNQCKGCHLRGDKVMPIGPSARQLNGKHTYATGEENQLLYWQSHDMIEALPDLSSVKTLTSYEDEKASVELRARAWLEINCAHCHRRDGPAKNSGLYLLASEKDSRVLGIGKAPVAAGKGSGGRLYSIIPGKPDESILQFRIESTHPGIMMPELGRQLTHTEGVELVRKWIAEMK